MHMTAYSRIYIQIGFCYYFYITFILPLYYFYFTFILLFIYIYIFFKVLYHIGEKSVIIISIINTNECQ